MTFPVSQSVLDADALAQELTSRFGLKGDVRCRLLSRGMNDIYRVEHSGGPHALKVARAGKSTSSEFSYEQEYVQHLHNQGLDVPTPVPLVDGSTFFSVDAPEGQRHVVMMRWLSGVPVGGIISEGDAFEMGALLARMHALAADFFSPHTKLVNSEQKLTERLTYLLALVDPQSEDHALLSQAGHHVLEELATIDQSHIPFGPCHGDLQCANVMRLESGGLGVFDFSDCGFDPLVKDLAAFDWRNDFDKRPQLVNESFAAGYDSVRARSCQEKQAQLLYRALRHLFITSTMAQFVNRIGPVEGFDRNLTYYIEMAYRYCRDAGIVYS